MAQQETIAALRWGSIGALNSAVDTRPTNFLLAAGHAALVVLAVSRPVT
jgi:hypothetical protein